MNYLKVSIIFSVFSLSCLFSTSLMAVNSKVDSIYNAIRGTWFKVYEVSGMTGERDSISTNDSIVISRILATDSISWKEYENGLLNLDFHFLINYSKSLLFQSDKWMLTNENIRRLVTVEHFGFSYTLDAYDGGGVGYSHSKIPNGLSEVVVLKNGIKIVQDQSNTISIIGNAKFEKVEMLDMNGRKHKSWLNVETNQKLEVTDLQPGLYLVIIDVDDTHVVSSIMKK